MRLFQSTRPLRGATRTYPTLWQTHPISIHAPLAGRDFDHDNIRRALEYFNPRAPCGARPSRLNVRSTATVFQSTRPLRGATRLYKQQPFRLLVFQSTRPLRGATRLYKQQPFRLLVFQSTRPLRGATTKIGAEVVQDAISIHAPLAGRDAEFVIPTRLPGIFQSTRPLRGATQYSTNTVPCISISIHAPLAGRDEH